MGKDKKLELVGIIQEKLRELKIIDINLQIEAVRIREPNAVNVIAENIRDVIMELEGEVNEILEEISRAND